MKPFIVALVLSLPVLMIGQVLAEPPSSFESSGEDRKSIEILLENYTRAASSKDQTLFESLLLNKTIPFSDATSVVKTGGADQGTQHYDTFRKGVFEGPAFTQRFEEVHIDQDGPLASVSLDRYRSGNFFRTDHPNSVCLRNASKAADRSPTNNACARPISRSAATGSFSRQGG